MRAGLASIWAVCAVAAGGSLLAAEAGRGDAAGPAAPPAAELYVASRFERNSEIFLVRADGSLVRNLTRTPRRSELELAISPDGTKLAFMHSGLRPSGGYTIAVADASARRRRELLLTPGIDWDPAWAPDGRRLVFLRKLRSGRPYELFLVRSDGTGLRRLTRNRTEELTPAWSPDGRFIAYTAQVVRIDSEGRRRRGGIDIFLLNLRSGTTTNLTRTAGLLEHEPAWSPDGKRIAFSGTTGRDTEIYTIARDGTARRRLTYDPALDGRPAWSPLGTHIAFVTGRWRDEADITGDYDIAVIAANGGCVRRLTTLPNWQEESVVWRPRARKDGADVPPC